VKEKEREQKSRKGVSQRRAFEKKNKGANRYTQIKRARKV
jgi:hypothetical protein